MDLVTLQFRGRELQRQTVDVYERLSAEQASLRRQLIVRLYTSLKMKLTGADQPAAASFLQLVIDEVNRTN